MEKFLNRVIPLSGQLLVMLYLKNKNLQATRFLSLFFSFPSLCPPLFFSLCTFVSASLKNIESPLGSKEIKPVNPKGNQPWIFIGRTEAVTPILWPPDAKSPLMEKTLILGKIEGRRRRGWQRMKRLDGITDSMSLSKLREIVKDREAWHAAVHGVAKSRTRLSNWTMKSINAHFLVLKVVLWLHKMLPLGEAGWRIYGNFLQYFCNFSTSLNLSQNVKAFLF